LENYNKLTVNLEKLKNNIIDLKKHCPQNQIMFMVKADAYGHGMIPIVRYSQTECEINQFGVATLDEAINIRHELPDLDNELYVFSNLNLEENSSLYAEMNIIPVLSSISMLDLFLKNNYLKGVPLVIKLNTGMNRLGIGQSEVELMIDKIKSNGRNKIYHLMTHLSSSSEKMDANNKSHKQKEIFDQIIKKISSNEIIIERTSISNSGAIEQSFGLDYSHVRPGLMLYGPSALTKDARQNSFWKGSSISSLETNILSIFSVKQGDEIGYSAEIINGNGEVVILSIGYGDGISTKLKGAKLTINNLTAEIIGRVNMDMLQLFFESGTLPFHVNDKIKLWSSDTSEILSISDKAEIIPYELYCSLTNRVIREYNI
jgi:alanine racemase